MSKINEIIEGIIEREGGYVNHKDDKGGATCWGITQRVARSCGYRGDMKCLPKSVARQIYRDKYYIQPNFNQVEYLSPGVAAELADTGVNMGQKRAAQFLQRSLNTFNRAGTDYDDLLTDGSIGPATITALNKYLEKRKTNHGETVLLRAMNVLQGAAYIEIAERNDNQEAFTYGWFAHRVSI